MDGMSGVGISFGADRIFDVLNPVSYTHLDVYKRQVKLLVDYPEPVYVRVGRAAVPDVYENDDFDFILGKANMLLNLSLIHI